MGKHYHLLEDVDADGPPVCTFCGVEAVERQGRWVCPIRWRNSHGRVGGRRDHVIAAYRGMVTCSCGADTVRLENGMWGCSTQQDQAIRGMRRQERIWTQ
jgi:hypothetical protein